jgi:hypothetical protein
MEVEARDVQNLHIKVNVENERKSHEDFKASMTRRTSPALTTVSIASAVLARPNHARS